MIAAAASRVTPAALNWLRQTRSARILSLHDRSCNLVNDRGALLALVAGERGLTPFGAALGGAEGGAWRLPRSLALTDEVRTGPARLVVGDLSVRLEGAAIWVPVPDWYALRRALQAAPEWLGLAAEVALLGAPPGSLLDGLLPARRGALGRPSDAARRAWAVAPAAVAALAAGDETGAVEAARALAGLGSGLTPAGDDFLVGLMLAAWAGLLGRGAESLCPALAQAAALRTTTLSGAFLRAAARGECAIYWHRLFEALLQRDRSGLTSALGELLAVGHTSGADALAGLLAAVSPLPQN